MTEALIAVYGKIAAERVVEITNRVDLQVFSPPKRDYRCGPVLRVISVGALNRNKNHLGLIQELAAHEQPCQLTLVGSGPLEHELVQAAADRGLPLQIWRCLNHLELSELLRSHDIYVHFSRSEAVSRAVLEAMAMGLPAIVTPVGFLGGIVVTDVTGIRIGDLGITDLSCAIDIVCDERARSRLGRAARCEIEARHEWNAIFKLHRSVLLGMTRQRSETTKAF